MKKKVVSLLIILSVSLLSGCASIFSSKYQHVSLETQDNQVQVDGAHCLLANNKGAWEVNTPGEVKIRKSPANLEIQCNKDQKEFHKAVVGSDVKPLFFGNILIGGLIGMVVDYVHGPGFGYPKEIVVDSKIGYVQDAHSKGKGRRSH